MPQKTLNASAIYLLSVFMAAIFATSSVLAKSFSTQDEHHVIADPRTGLAIFGYDPVAYHSDQAALVGSKEHEFTRDGLIWRFRSAANMAAFVSDPLAYVPTFGGHDGAIVSEGMLAKGDPETFVIAGGKVVFFRTQQNRDRFAAEREVRQRALQSWANVVRQHAAH
jgi:hypothetical protein